MENSCRFRGFDKRREIVDGTAQHVTQRACLFFDLIRPTGGDIPGKPSRDKRKIAPTHGKRTERIAQPFWHLTNDARHRHRHDGGSPEHPCIAEGCAATWLVRIDDEDVVAVAL